MEYIDQTLPLKEGHSKKAPLSSEPTACNCAPDFLEIRLQSDPDLLPGASGRLNRQSHRRPLDTFSDATPHRFMLSRGNHPA